MKEFFIVLLLAIFGMLIFANKLDIQHETAMRQAAIGQANDRFASLCQFDKVLWSNQFEHNSNFNAAIRDLYHLNHIEDINLWPPTNSISPGDIK